MTARTIIVISTPGSTPTSPTRSEIGPVSHTTARQTDTPPYSQRERLALPRAAQPTRREAPRGNHQTGPDGRECYRVRTQQLLEERLPSTPALEGEDGATHSGDGDRRENHATETSHSRCSRLETDGPTGVFSREQNERRRIRENKCEHGCRSNVHNRPNECSPKIGSVLTPPQYENRFLRSSANCPYSLVDLALLFEFVNLVFSFRVIHPNLLCTL